MARKARRSAGLTRHRSTSSSVNAALRSRRRSIVGPRVVPANQERSRPQPGSSFPSSARRVAEAFEVLPSIPSSAWTEFSHMIRDLFAMAADRAPHARRPLTTGQAARGFCRRLAGPGRWPEQKNASWGLTHLTQRRRSLAARMADLLGRAERSTPAAAIAARRKINRRSLHKLGRRPSNYGKVRMSARVKGFG
jgi:hypothetical protein